MIVVDSSALVAILNDEETSDILIRALIQSKTRVISSSTLLECSIVVFARWGDPGLLRLNQLILESNIEVIPFTQKHAEVAIEGYKKYGKGRHPAGLNYGDCFSYAHAIVSDAPLLFVGTDFSLTDVKH